MGRIGTIFGIEEIRPIVDVVDTKKLSVSSRYTTYFERFIAKITKTEINTIIRMYGAMSISEVITILAFEPKNNIFI